MIQTAVKLCAPIIVGAKNVPPNACRAAFAEAIFKPCFFRKANAKRRRNRTFYHMVIVFSSANASSRVARFSENADAEPVATPM